MSALLTPAATPPQLVAATSARAEAAERRMRELTEGLPNLTDAQVQQALAASIVRRQEATSRETLDALAARARQAESDAAAAHEALAASAGENELLRQELARLSQRAEDAERQLLEQQAGGEQQAALRELQAQLQRSEERALRGEQLVAKLRHFIADDAAEAYHEGHTHRPCAARWEGG